VQNIQAPVISYQTCWDGSVIPTTSACASQYKICPNGSSVLVTQQCPIVIAPVTPNIPTPVKVVFNNVVTNLATQVTQKEGRCNGIGLIAQNAPSTGWFEYGETSNLGRTTVQANIGSSDTAPFSNLLTNLKPNTTYYCRAVMQNKHGIVKGEIVKFTTKSSVTKYVAPAPKPVVTKKVTTTKKEEKGVVCTDGTTLSIKNDGVATLLSEGNKLATLSVEKVAGTLATDEVVKYRVAYRNLADSRLTGVVVKVKLPEEFRVLETSGGLYDANTRTITLNQDVLDPYTEGSVSFSALVAKNAPLGKTVIVNSYIAYSVPGSQAQDEITAYVVGSIVPKSSVENVDTGAKKVVGVSYGGSQFLPDTLIEWLALLAILFIIFILGRSLYASYKGENGSHH
jgi:hypothetical protein